MVRVALLLAPVFAFKVVAGSGGFLKAQVNKNDVKQAFLDELQGLASSSRLTSLKAGLEPLFKSLPKNQMGNIDSPTVRYAIHRYFANRYGWQVKGLSSEGQSWNSSSSAEVMKNRVPNYIFELFEEQVNGQGFDLSGLATFAAVMEDLVHQEAANVLARIFKVLRTPLVDMSEDDVDRAIAIFFAAFNLGSFELKTRLHIDSIEEDIYETAPKFDETKMWMKDLRQTMDFHGKDRRNPFIPQQYSFQYALDVAEKVMQTLGSWERAECQSLKEVLTDMDHDNLGRFPLADYYANDHITFHESADYLRLWGILDETNPKVPKVVIPNLIQSSGNCVMVTDYYSVCCADECEGLMRQMEAKIAGPSAPPSKIVEVVSNLQPDGLDAPRNISTLLLNRLEDMASIHGGEVQLHGRLFMQWMHHAFPQECAYPHVSGTVKPVSEVDWADWAGMDDVMATDEEKKRLMIKDPSHDTMTLDEKISAIPWSSVEELVATPRRHAPGSSMFKQARFLIGLLALGSMMLPLFRASKTIGVDAAREKALCV